MTDKIVIKTEYWKDNKLMIESSGEFGADKTIPEISKVAHKALENNMANIITEYLTK